MTQVAKLTTAQKAQLLNQEFGSGRFNPVQDANGNWIISLEEVAACGEQFAWVADLPLIDFNPVIVEK